MMRFPRGRRPGSRDADVTAADIDILGKDDNVYAQGVDAGHRMDPRARKILVMCVVLVVLYLVGLVFPKDLFYLFRTGQNELFTFAEYLSRFTDNVSGLVAVRTGNTDSETGGNTGSG